MVGMVKVNCDAAVSKENGSGIGFVVRDQLGAVLHMGTKTVNYSEEVEWTEAEAIFWALSQHNCRVGLLIAYCSLQNSRMGVDGKAFWDGSRRRFR
ncbi:hypothetical protein V2J09_021576 [Rumex salicifolius]